MKIVCIENDAPLKDEDNEDHNGQHGSFGIRTSSVLFRHGVALSLSPNTTSTSTSPGGSSSPFALEPSPTNRKYSVRRLAPHSPDRRRHCLEDTDLEQGNGGGSDLQRYTSKALTNISESADDDGENALPLPSSSVVVGTGRPSSSKLRPLRRWCRKHFLSLQMLLDVGIFCMIVLVSVLSWYLNDRATTESLTLVVESLMSAEVKLGQEQLFRKLQFLSAGASMDDSYLKARNLSILSFHDMEELVDGMWVSQAASLAADVIGTNVIGNERNEMLALLLDGNGRWLWNVKSSPTANFTVHLFVNNSLLKYGRSLPPVAVDPSFVVMERDWYLYGKYFGRVGEITFGEATWRIYGTSRPNLYVPCGWKIVNGSGSLAGVMGKGISLNSLSNYLQATADHGSIFIFERNSHGYLIAVSHGAIAADETRLRPEQSAYQQIAIVGKFLLDKFDSYGEVPGNHFEYLKEDGLFMKTAHVRVSGSAAIDYIIVVVKDRDFIMSRTDKNSRDTLIINMSLAVFSLIFVSIIIHMVTRHLRKMGETMEAITTLSLRDSDFGKRRAREPVLYELARLQKQFVLMARNILSFSRFMPMSLAKLIIQKRVHDGPGMEPTNLTVLFVDIKGFTSLCERISTDELQQITAIFFQEMCTCIQAHEGTIDKFIGDCIMAFWNAPEQVGNHPLKCLETVDAMSSVLEKMNETLASRNLPTISVRIGVNTGTCLVGNMGTETRLSYTTVGDTVNLAARLESLCRMFGTRSLISEHTVLALEYLSNATAVQTTQFILRPLGRVRVVGKNESTGVYELLSQNDFKSPRRMVWLVHRTERALHHFFEQRFHDALDTFHEIQSQYPQDVTSKIYIQRCTRLIQHLVSTSSTMIASSDDWHDGVWVLNDK